MARVEQVHEKNMSPEARAAHDYHIEHVGRMTNMKRTLLNNVPTFEVLMDWYKLRDEARKFLDDLEINLFCYAISSENKCLICSLFFVKLLKDAGIDYEKFQFNDRQQAIIDYGRALVENPKAIPNGVFDKLKAHFNAEQLVVLTGFAGLMIATNLINHALEVELDGYLEKYI